MIDLHCHILPGIDDGAGDPDTARRMLEREMLCGADRVILTPHFNPERQSLTDFLLERERSWERLQGVAGPGIELRLGAEVACSFELLSMDLGSLTLGGSCYLLLELPAGRYPAFMERFAQELLGRGVIPILAHVERCAYFRREPGLLKRLVEMGLLAQVTAAALKDRRDRNFARACLEHGLAQIVASDAHDLHSRPPRMDVLKGLPERVQWMHRACTEAVWGNELPPYIIVSDIRRGCFQYR